MSNDGLTSYREPGAVVTFLIGKESDPPKTFLVHKEYACYASPVFDAAFNSNCIEGQTQTYKLDDTTPHAFQLLVQWIYHEKLKIVRLANDVQQLASQTDDEKWDEDDALVELWILANKLRMQSLQNLVIDTLHAVEQKTKTSLTQCYNYIYEKTAPGSKLRKFAVEKSACALGSSVYKELPGHFPHEMLLDMMTFISGEFELASASDADELTAYHVPVDEESD
jgi:hypothetical protein